MRLGGLKKIFQFFAFIFQLSELPSASIGGAIAPLAPPVPPPLTKTAVVVEYMFTHMHDGCKLFGQCLSQK